MTAQKIKADLSDDELIEILEQLWEDAEDGMMQQDIGTAIRIIKNHDLRGYHVHGDNHPKYGKAKRITLRYNYKHPTNFAANENNVKKTFTIAKS